MRRAVHLGSLALFVVLAAVPASAGPQAKPGKTVRVSLADDGSQSDGWSYNPTISADGRFVAFRSAATNLVPEGDTNEDDDIYRRDRVTGRTERVTDGLGGAQANGTSWLPSISGDGRFVAFQSDATNLVEGDTNGFFDIFVRDMQTNSTERVSVTSEEGQSNHHAQYPDISPDGRFVAFESGSPNLTPEAGTQSIDVFLRDRAAGTTELISVSLTGTEGDRHSFSPSLSADGRYVAFYSRAANLVADDTNGADDVFLRDRAAGTTVRLSVPNTGGEADGSSSYATISDDGSVVAFDSGAANLVPRDANGARDIFVWERQSARVQRVSVSSAGEEGDGSSDFATVSPDGRYVGYSSIASNLVPGGTSAFDAIVYDRLARTTENISIADDGGQSDINEHDLQFTPGGREVAFWSSSSNLVSGDTNDGLDVFVRDRGPAVGIVELSASPVDPGKVRVTGSVRLSGLGIASAADPPADGDTLSPIAGGEITGAAVWHRPEESDVLVAISYAELPGPVPAALGVMHIVTLRAGPKWYEVRLTESLTSPVMPTLFRCDPVCAEVGTLPGGLGTTAEELVFSLPLATIGLEPGQWLTAMSSRSEVPLPNGDVRQLDQMVIGDAHVPTSSVSVSLDGGSPATVTLDGLRFATTRDATPGGHGVTATVCVAGMCGNASIDVQV